MAALLVFSLIVASVFGFIGASEAVVTDSLAKQYISLEETCPTVSGFGVSDRSCTFTVCGSFQFSASACGSSSTQVIIMMYSSDMITSTSGLGYGSQCATISNYAVVSSSCISYTILQSCSPTDFSGCSVSTTYTAVQSTSPSASPTVRPPTVAPSQTPPHVTAAPSIHRPTTRAPTVVSISASCPVVEAFGVSDMSCSFTACGSFLFSAEVCGTNSRQVSTVLYSSDMTPLTPNSPIGTECSSISDQLVASSTCETYTLMQICAPSGFTSCSVSTSYTAVGVQTPTASPSISPAMLTITPTGQPAWQVPIIASAQVTFNYLPAILSDEERDVVIEAAENIMMSVGGNVELSVSGQRYLEFGRNAKLSLTKSSDIKTQSYYYLDLYLVAAISDYSSMVDSSTASAKDHVIELMDDVLYRSTWSGGLLSEIQNVLAANGLSSSSLTSASVANAGVYSSDSSGSASTDDEWSGAMIGIVAGSSAGGVVVIALLVVLARYLHASRTTVAYEPVKTVVVQPVRASEKEAHVEMTDVVATSVTSSKAVYAGTVALPPPTVLGTSSVTYTV